MTRPRSYHRILLSSITSTELRKVVFRCVGNWRGLVQRMERWSSIIDKQLCGLVDRLRVMGYCHTLEVEVRLMEIGGDPVKDDLTKFLPEFREKGVVIITDGDWIHSSALGNCS